MLCSVAKRAGSGRARKKCRGKHEMSVECFSLYYFLSSASQQNRAQLRLLYLIYDEESIHFRIDRLHVTSSFSKIES